MFVIQVTIINNIFLIWLVIFFDLIKIKYFSLASFCIYKLNNDLSKYFDLILDLFHKMDINYLVYYLDELINSDRIIIDYQLTISRFYIYLASYIILIYALAFSINWQTLDFICCNTHKQLINHVKIIKLYFLLLLRDELSFTF